MLIKSVLLIVIGTLTLFAGIKSFSHHRGGHFNEARMEKRADYMIKRVSSQLDLNADQIAKLEVIKQELLTNGIPLAKSRGDIADVLLNEAVGTDFDATAVNAVFEQKENDFEQLRSNLVEQVAAFHASLSDEQREKLNKKLAKIKEKRSRHK